MKHCGVRTWAVVLVGERVHGKPLAFLKTSPKLNLMQAL
jgi:hypothetical protein